MASKANSNLSRSGDEDSKNHIKEESNESEGHIDDSYHSNSQKHDNLQIYDESTASNFTNEALLHDGRCYTERSYTSAEKMALEKTETPFKSNNIGNQAEKAYSSAKRDEPLLSALDLAKKSQANSMQKQIPKGKTI